MTGYTKCQQKNFQRRERKRLQKQQQLIVPAPHICWKFCAQKCEWSIERQKNWDRVLEIMKNIFYFTMFYSEKNVRHVLQLIEVVTQKCELCKCDAGEIRRIFNERFSWAIPSSTIIEAIGSVMKENELVLSLGSGNGFWENLLYYYHKMNIIATDIEPATSCFFAVERINAVDAVKDYNDAQVLFICWPTYQGLWPLEAVREFKGHTVIYIGEYMDGCCATNSFFREMHEGWDERFVLGHPTFDRVFDGCSIFTRKFRWGFTKK